MTASTTERPALRRPRGPIERPRLMKQLDAAQERILLLSAPAGYGKTTLARQWAKTVQRVAWVACTPAHRDIVVLAEDVAAEVERLGGARLADFQTYLRARPNPQRAARDIAAALAKRVNEARVQWLIVDDYHELAEVPEVADAFAILVERIDARVMIASRVRPDWATSRRALYGEIFELDRETLTMDPEEAAAVVGGARGRERLLEQAKGWPAVLALAASPRAPEAPAESVPDTLHQYLAEELFAAATPTLRDRLIEMALLPETSRPALRSRWADADETIEHAREIGFLTASDEPELHPLIREFLLLKLRTEPEGECRARTAIAACEKAGAWSRAFELILRFELFDLMERTLERAYRPLLSRGRIETLARCSAVLAQRSVGFPPAVVDLIDAEVALRVGEFVLAASLAERAERRFEVGHPLRPRAAMVRGQSAWGVFEPRRAEIAFRDVLAGHSTHADIGEALYGLALISLHEEVPIPSDVVGLLKARRDNSPTDLVRWASVQLLHQRIIAGYPARPEIEEALRERVRCEDPRMRTSIVLNASYAYALRADFPRALELALTALSEVEELGLTFARPHIDAVLASVNVGLRRFTHAHRHLERLDAYVEEHPNAHHEINRQIVRAEIALATGAPEAAVAAIPDVIPKDTPSTTGELFGIAAISHAVCGDRREAIANATCADGASTAVEVRALAATARAILAADAGDEVGAQGAIHIARTFGMWKALLVGLRASQPLLLATASNASARRELAWLFRRTNDFGLARRASIQLPAAQDPHAVLSPRELEVLSLIAKGFRNRDISAALVIADSTTKVHVRHVLEKLGVRSRAEAAARYADLLSYADNADRIERESSRSRPNSKSSRRPKR